MCAFFAIVSKEEEKDVRGRIEVRKKILLHHERGARRSDGDPKRETGAGSAGKEGDSEIREGNVREFLSPEGDCVV